jgi:hypothetical protein
MTYTVIPAGGEDLAIVDLSGTPPVRLTAGQHGLATTFEQTGTGIIPVNFPTTNFLPLVRIPANAVVHQVLIATDTFPSTSLEFDVGLCWSNGSYQGLTDGTQAAFLSTYALTGAVADIFSQSAFAYNYTYSTTTPALGLWQDITFQNALGNSATDGFYVPSASVKPIWQALAAGGTGGLGKATAAVVGNGAGSCFLACPVLNGVPTYPFGYLDVTLFSTVTGVNTAAVNVSLRVIYSNAAD